MDLCFPQLQPHCAILISLSFDKNKTWPRIEPYNRSGQYHVGRGRWTSCSEKSGCKVKSERVIEYNDRQVQTLKTQRI